ncbi:MAG: KEOPS complex subunit Cgi121 [Candidatus Bathyarchaeota archaeon]|nr:KEOPS complex subunit Cgi121 [Candidatus Bathyarchaeota archaeon]
MMLQQIEEFGKYVEITGYRNISFSKVDEFLKANRKQNNLHVEVQFFEADLIATQEHLYFAVLNALQAFHSKTNKSKSVAMETMLYAAAQRQIQKAIDKIGVKPETKAMAVVVVGSSPKCVEAMIKELTSCVGSEPDDSVLKLTKPKQQKIKETFQISAEQLKTQPVTTEEALVNLVIEDVALLSTQL